MPPSEEVIDNSIDILGQVQLDSFTATPATIPPFGESVLSWRVSKLPNNVRLSLGGRTPGENLPAEGSRIASPRATTTYQLVASTSVIDSILGKVTVNVDTTDCVTFPIPEVEIRTQVQEGLEQDDGRKEQVLGIDVEIRLRRPAEIEIDENGLHISIALEAKIPNFPNPKIDVDALIILSASNGQPVFTYAKFDTNVHLPWWTWLPGILIPTLVPGTTGVPVNKLLEELIEKQIRPRIKEQMDFQINQVINENLDRLPDFLGLFALTTLADQVEAVGCPVDQPISFPLTNIRVDIPSGISLAPITAAEREAGELMPQTPY